MPIAVAVKWSNNVPFLVKDTRQLALQRTLTMQCTMPQVTDGSTVREIDGAWDHAYAGDHAHAG